MTNNFLTQINIAEQALSFLIVHLKITGSCVKMIFFTLFFGTRIQLKLQLIVVKLNKFLWSWNNSCTVELKLVKLNYKPIRKISFVMQGIFFHNS